MTAENLPDLYVRIVKDQLSLQEIKSIPDIFRKKMPSIRRLSSEVGREKIEAFIELWILQLNRYLNLPMAMNEYQIRETAQEIFNLYTSEGVTLTLADISFVFDQAKQGKVEKLYQYLNGAIILKWFEEHWHTRCEVAAAQSESEHLQFKVDQGIYSRTKTDRRRDDTETKSAFRTAGEWYEKNSKT